MSDKKGISDADNEMAGRFLIGLCGAAAIVLFLLVSPIVIGGFLIGLIWYGAYMSEGEPNGEKLAWPVGITGLVFIYLFGIFPPFSEYFQGILFSDFAEWTGHKVWEVLTPLNQLLTHRFAIKNVQIAQVRIFFWLIIPAAAGFFGFLYYKGAGKGVFVYQVLWQLLMPLRVLASWWQVMAGISGIIWVVGYFGFLAVPHWLGVGVGMLTVLKRQVQKLKVLEE